MPFFGQWIPATIRVKRCSHIALLTPVKASESGFFLIA